MFQVICQIQYSIHLRNKPTAVQRCRYSLQKPVVLHPGEQVFTRVSVAKNSDHMLGMGKQLRKLSAAADGRSQLDVRGCLVIRIVEKCANNLEFLRVRLSVKRENSFFRDDCRTLMHSLVSMKEVSHWAR